MRVGKPSGASGPRSNMYSGSKLSNWSRYNPWGMEIDKALQKLPKSSHKLQIHKFPVHSDFMLPLDIEDVKTALEKLGPDVANNLKTILLLSGTTKQKSFGRGARFGLYSKDRGLIAIHALPKHLQIMQFKHGLSPAKRHEYTRAGAIFKSPDTVIFDDAAVRRFLLDDVLLHEIGHHLDRENFTTKSNKKAEGFAEWFATEHGFRRTNNMAVLR
jgi:hypothetical protein